MMEENLKNVEPKRKTFYLDMSLLKQVIEDKKELLNRLKDI